MSLLVHLIASGKFSGKKILAVDRQEKNLNDRTWCFWEKEPGMFEQVVAHRWESLLFRSLDDDVPITPMDIRPFQYKMIRGIDFYDFCLKKIRDNPNIEVRYGQVDSVTRGGIVLDGVSIKAGWVFCSIPPPPPAPQRSRFRLLQHFLGREIMTTEPVFTPGTATLMDFRVAQTPGTAFVYVMPFSSTRALVEYTVFSAGLLKEADYAAALDDYIRRFITVDPYQLMGTEYGVIPMTNERGPVGGSGLTYTGTAGGQTKPSSGYTFSFIQRQSARIVSDILATGEPQPENTTLRYVFYDSVLLNVLSTGKKSGQAVFSRMFHRNSPGDILAFLGNDSNWKQDLRILGSMQLIPFTLAGMQELWALRR